MSGRVLLISPQFRVLTEIKSVYSKNALRRAQPLLGIGSMAASLKAKGYEVQYLDSVIEDINNTFPFDDTTSCYGLNYDAIVDRVQEYKPDIVGISCLFSSMFPQTIILANKIKKLKHSLPIIMGGNHASLNIKEVMEHDCFDFILKGEGEFLMAELVGAIINKHPLEEIRSIVYRDGDVVKETEGFERIANLNDLAPFDWDLVPLKKYWKDAIPQNPYSKSKKILPYETSRGCPEKCIFCSTARFFSNKFRAKSAKRVVEEIGRAINKYGAEEIQFVDDNIGLNIPRFMEICEGLTPYNLHLCAPSGMRLDYVKNNDKLSKVLTVMKKAGFYQITFAVESGNDDVLNNVIRKRLDLDRMHEVVQITKAHGLKTHAFFLIGLPTETKEQMQDTISYAQKLDADSYSVSIATPFPATDLRDWIENDDLFIDGFKESDLLFGRSVIARDDGLDSKKMEELAETVSVKLNNKEEITIEW